MHRDTLNHSGTTVIVPCAGRSSRYDEGPPKWMRTAPDGRPMVVKALEGIEGMTDVVVTILFEHEQRWDATAGLERAFRDHLPCVNLQVHVLPEQTQSQSDTVIRTIRDCNITGRILIKDSDGAFALQLNPPPMMGNYVCTSDLTQYSSVNARNKSYCVLGDQGRIDAIHEKRIVGTTFSVGGYCIEDADVFVRYAQDILDNFPTEEVYVSHVIMDMIVDDYTFHSVPVNGFQDWGTGEDWARYCGGYKTFFIDIDGVLQRNAGRYFLPRRTTQGPLEGNCTVIRRLYEEGNHIVLTTARPEDERDMTVEQLDRAGVLYHQLVMGTLHAGRVLVNDFAPTNSFPSATAINTPRNGDIEPYLKHYFKDDQ